MIIDSMSLFGDNIVEIQAESTIEGTRIHIITRTYGINLKHIYRLISTELLLSLNVKPSIKMVWAYKRNNMMIYAFDVSIF